MTHTRIDVHNHTVASGHAFSTLQEMAKAASEKGMEYLGVTEHAPSIPGSCHPIYFSNYPSVPRQMYGVKLLMGCELNILDSAGNLDLDERYYRYMDIMLAGIHCQCWTPGTKEENTEGLLNVMANPQVNVIVHPADGTAELDFEPLVRASAETRTVLEINSASMKPYRKKTMAAPNNAEILRLCKKYGVPVILAADAHISFDIADYRYALPLIDETEFPESLILNYQPEEFFKFTGIPMP